MAWKGRCKIEGCPAEYYAKGYCEPHFREHRAAEHLCSVYGCQRTTVAKGLCKTHYARHRLGLPLVPFLPKPRRPTGEICAGPDCTAPAQKNGYCHTHNGQRKRGEPLQRMVTVPGRKSRVRESKVPKLREITVRQEPTRKPTMGEWLRQAGREGAQ